MKYFFLSYLFAVLIFFRNFRDYGWDQVWSIQIFLICGVIFLDAHLKPLMSSFWTLSCLLDSIHIILISIALSRTISFSRHLFIRPSITSPNTLGRCRCMFNESKNCFEPFLFTTSVTSTTNSFIKFVPIFYNFSLIYLTALKQNTAILIALHSGSPILFNF